MQQVKQQCKLFHKHTREARQQICRLHRSPIYLSSIHTHIYIYVYLHLHTCIHLVPLETFGAVLSIVQTDAVLTTDVGRIRRAGWRAGGRTLVAVGGSDPQASKEFGSFGVFLLNQIIRQLNMTYIFEAGQWYRVKCFYFLVCWESQTS